MSSNSCPYCAYPLGMAEAQRSTTDAQAIEQLSREVRQLRETVARLRGSGHAHASAARLAAETVPPPSEQG